MSEKIRTLYPIEANGANLLFQKFVYLSISAWKAGFDVMLEAETAES